MTNLPERQPLKEALVLIQQTATYRLPPGNLFLFGAAADTPAYAKRWDELSRHVASAQLAIIRDEFATRFPSFAVETNSFTFGISDPIVDRYVSLLKPRDPADVTNLVMEMLDGLFPPVGFLRKRRLAGLSTLGVRLTASLTAFAQQVERQFGAVT